MDYEVNTVIIGGGPAGTACGIRLQASGVSSIIIEKRAYPREKLCAGLVTNKTLRQINRLWHLQHPGQALPADLFCSETGHVEFWLKDERLLETRASTPFHFVQRSRFDQFLSRLYTEAGGRLLENSFCTGIDMNGRTLTLQNGDTVTFRNLVAADGATSRTRTLLGIGQPQLSFCLETRVPKPEHAEMPVKVCFGTIENGYAWIFPSGDQVCVGICGIYQKETDYRAAFARFLNAHEIDAPWNTWKGAFLPGGETLCQINNPPDAVLIGDAGGFVDPVYGEGLFFALSSGIAAAISVLRSKKNSTTLRSEFVKATALYRKTIRQGKTLQRLLYSDSFWRHCKRFAVGKSRFAAFYMDHLVHEYHYSYAAIGKMILRYKCCKKHL